MCTQSCTILCTHKKHTFTNTIEFIFNTWSFNSSISLSPITSNNALMINCLYECLSKELKELMEPN